MAALNDDEGVVLWPGLCGTQDDPGVIWDSSLTLYTPRPDLPQCFQDTVLVWLPCLVLWLGAPIYLYLLHTRHIVHPPCKYSAMNAAKLCLCVGMIIVKVADIILEADLAPDMVLSRWTGDAVYILTLVFAVYLLRYEFHRGAHSSGLFFCFWLAVLICSIIPFYSEVIRTLDKVLDDPARLICSFTFMLISTIQFIIHIFVDKGAFGPKFNPDIYRRADTKPLFGKVRHSTGEHAPLLGGKGSQDGIDKAFPVQNPPSPESSSSFASSIFYAWVWPLMILGWKRELTGEKLWELEDANKARPLMRDFYRNWLRSTKNKHRSYENSSMVLVDDIDEDGNLPDYHTIPGNKKKSIGNAKSSGILAPEFATWKSNSSLSKSLWKTFGAYYMFIGIWEVFTIVLTFMRPLIQDALIGYVDSPTSYEWQGYVYAFSLFLITIIRSLFNQQHFIGKMICGMRVRSSLTSAVYRKALLLSNSARNNYSLGEIVNLMAIDAQRVSDCTFFLHNFWSAPVNIIVAMVLLWQYLGPASLAGLAVLVLLVFGNLFLASKVKKLQVNKMKFQDQRTKLTYEVLNGIKVLKLYAWEEPFQDRLMDIRNSELSFIQKSALYFSGTVISISCAPVMFAVVAFTIYILGSGNTVLSAQVAFVSLSLLSSLSRPLTFLPNGIANFVQAQVSIRRLENYLNHDELDPSIIQAARGDTAVEIKDASFSWEGPGTPNVISDINLHVKRGEFTCIVGQVGSGKSSLVQSLMGELYKSSGEIFKQGTIAYVPQEAWIRNLTVESNILFGKDMRRRKYEEAIDVCCLRPDIQVLTAGDQTEIGEKGINLSGGQKQRVSLARAVYADSDIYLFDDPLSAVDSHVGKAIYNQVLGQEGVLRNKTRILVTHGITYLSKADNIIVMKDGVISENGHYDELLDHNGAFADFMRTHLSAHQEDEESSGSEVDEEEKELRRELSRRISLVDGSEHSLSGSHTPGSNTPRRRKSRLSTTSQHSVERQLSTGKGAPPARNAGPGGGGGRGGRGGPGKRLIDDERSEQGGVKWPILFAYITSVGCFLVFLIIISNVANVVTDLSSNIWLASWSADSDLQAKNMTFTDPGIRVGVYAGLGFLTTVSLAVQTISLAVACTVASRILHTKLLVRILRAPQSFFDTTPLGRILNRFSNDISTADTNLRMTIIATFRGVASLITTIIAITYSTPIFIAVLVPLAIMYVFVQRFYVSTANQLRRLQNVRTSPLYSHFGETVAGATSVRAYKRQSDYIEDADVRLDSMQMARYSTLVVNRWLSVSLETLGSLVVFFAALFAILNKENITAGLVGLSVSYALQVTDRLAMFLRNSSDLENNVVSLERIKEYSSVAMEAPWEVPGNTPPKQWPEKGQIRFKEYATRYRSELDLVLKDIFCTIQGGEKVGIVGRTGAGKSSMTLALFRIIEASQGNVYIDDVDTGKIGLHELRHKLTIIPQDPILFSGSIRFNLDPFNTQTDEALWSALANAHLKGYIRSQSQGLDYECTEGGSNLSVGQRQLVCLARALLRKTKILVLDEATAAVDLETDALIQNTIRTEFADCTVITIAHRLNTILDYDRVMVLDAGQIQEFDTPTVLQENKASAFSAMCKDAGIFMQSDTPPEPQEEPVAKPPLVLALSIEDLLDIENSESEKDEDSQGENTEDSKVENTEYLFSDSQGEKKED